MDRLQGRETGEGWGYRPESSTGVNAGGGLWAVGGHDTRVFDLCWSGLRKVLIHLALRARDLAVGQGVDKWRREMGKRASLSAAPFPFPKQILNKKKKKKVQGILLKA